LSSGRRFFLGAFGDAGHAFPMIALGAELVRRGHDVTLQTWTRWQEHVEAEGMTFACAHRPMAPDGGPLKPYQAALRAAKATLPLLEELRPQCVVSDIITVSPALAGEAAGVPVATLVPHVDPRPFPGQPPFSMGARMPRTAAGRAFWRATTERLVAKGLEQGRVQLNGTRERLGLRPLSHPHNGLSHGLCLIGTLPQLEYPRPPQPGAQVVGPLLWEIAGEAGVAPPPEPAGAPVVLVAPSTAQDHEHRMLRAALEGLADEPVRVIATWNRREPDPPLEVPPNAVVVDWLSYAKTMPHCDVVVSHAGHGTLMRALACGCALVCCPATGDMMENAARVDWAGLGVRLPRRLVTPRGVRLAVRRVLASERIRARVAEAQAWCAEHDGAARAAELVERFGAVRASAPLSA
jgi:UDP:flavonoid glycosyltransferase YjiC (YdhE family)